jgi:hypothetical protein
MDLKRPLTVGECAVLLIADVAALTLLIAFALARG